MKRHLLVLVLSAAAWFGMAAMFQSRIVIEDDSLTAAVWVATGLPVLYVAGFLLVDPLYRRIRDVRLCVESFRLALASVFLLFSIACAFQGWAPAGLRLVLPLVAAAMMNARIRALRSVLLESHPEMSLH